MRKVVWRTARDLTPKRHVTPCSVVEICHFSTRLHGVTASASQLLTPRLMKQRQSNFLTDALLVFDSALVCLKIRRFRPLVLRIRIVLRCIYVIQKLCRTINTSWKADSFPGSQEISQTPAFQGTRRFITVFTTSRYLFMCRARRIRSAPLLPSCWFKIHFSIPQSALSGFPTNTLCAFLFCVP